MQADRVLSVESLCKTFHTKAGDVTAVDNATFSARKGEVTAIVGPSGSGKTTLLYVIGSLEKPDSGTVEVAGVDVTRTGTNLVDFRRTDVGFVFQFFNLVGALTALENVTLPMDLAGVPVKEQKQRAAELLEKIGIDTRLQKSRPNKISGGERQRVAIARALANQPEVILADEPTGNLDSETGNTVVAILVRLAREEGKCVIIVTHDESIQEIADQSFHMSDGRLTGIA